LAFRSIIIGSILKCVDNRFVMPVITRPFKAVAISLDYGWALLPHCHYEEGTLWLT